MYALTVNKELSTAEQLEQLAEQAGGTHHVNLLVARVEKPGMVLMVTLVNHGSPGPVQQWTVVNGSESAPASFATYNGEFFEDERYAVYSPTAQSYVAHLLERGRWTGAAAPYYPE